MKKTLTILYYTVLIAISIVAVVLIISVFPFSGNIKILTVLSGSMEPAIKTGSVVVIKPAAEYALGDVVTFGPNTKTEIPTTHRIVDMRVQNGEILYKTQGDANDSADSKEIGQKDVIGKVLFSVPFAGYLIDIVRKPIGFMALIFIPAILIIYEEIKKVFREVKQMHQKKSIESTTSPNEN